MPGLRKRGPDDPSRRDRGIGCLMRWRVVYRPKRENPSTQALTSRMIVAHLPNEPMRLKGSAQVRDTLSNECRGDEGTEPTSR
jgi:hypothetical protein